jgi:DNA modification methylase
MLEPYYKSENGILYCGDVNDVLSKIDIPIQMCVTSPPYFGLRNYQHSMQLGLEETPQQYVSNMTEVFSKVGRILKKDGTVWLNIGDTYCGGGRGVGSVKQKTNKGIIDMPCSIVPAGLKPKDLMGIPWRIAFSLQDEGWYLRQDIIWHKPNPMPESVTDRCTKAHEYLFLLSKSRKYYFDYAAIQEEATGYDGRKDTMMKGSPKYAASVVPGKKARAFGETNPIGTQRNDVGNVYVDKPFRNKRSVWMVNTKPYKEAHFATFPEKLIEPCILAGSKEGDYVLDPFMGSGTTAAVCERLGRKWVGIEINQDYCDIIVTRLAKTTNVSYETKKPIIVENKGIFKFFTI